MTPRLSICIATLNRAAQIGETLDAFLPQLTDETEIVVLDGASTDDTGAVVAHRAARDVRVRYIRANVNSGVDADFDRSVVEARGRHCWLFSDDDTIAPDAVATVLAELARGDPDLLIVDAEVRDMTMSHVFEPRRMADSPETTDYTPADRNEFLADAGNALSFIGGTIIRRDAWLVRDRRSYYGSLFVHAGVIFQEPPLPHSRILRRPLVRIRMGNAMWSPRAFEIWMFKWPQLIWSFAGYSDSAKARAALLEPWRQLILLLQYRAYGSFGPRDYRERLRDKPLGWKHWPARIVAGLPGPVAHVLMSAYLAWRDAAPSSVSYNLLVASRHSNPLSRMLGRRAGQPLSERTRHA